MQRRPEVEAVTGVGLEGDRYTHTASRFSAHYQVTLIELENIEAFTGETGLPLTAEMPRRNIVTRGVRLNALVGKRFRVGAALFEGMELCEPCSLFAKRTHREVVKVLAGKGGLRAAVVEGGAIRAGDRLEELNFRPAAESDVRVFTHDKTHPLEGT
jgi:MOSC domain-containing protein YiiM